MTGTLSLVNGTSIICGILRTCVVLSINRKPSLISQVFTSQNGWNTVNQIIEFVFIFGPTFPSKAHFLLVDQHFQVRLTFYLWTNTSK